MADSAPETTYVSKPAYPQTNAKPKVTSRPPASSAKRPSPVTIAGTKSSKDKPDPMMLARLSRLMAPAAMRGGR